MSSCPAGGFPSFYRCRRSKRPPPPVAFFPRPFLSRGRYSTRARKILHTIPGAGAGGNEEKSTDQRGLDVTRGSIGRCRVTDRRVTPRVSGYAAPAIRMHGCVPFLPCGVTRVVGRAGMRESDNLLFIETECALLLFVSYHRQCLSLTPLSSLLNTRYTSLQVSSIGHET